MTCKKGDKLKSKCVCIGSKLTADKSKGKKKKVIKVAAIKKPRTE